jgi:hypothetical protein
MIREPFLLHKQNNIITLRTLLIACFKLFLGLYFAADTLKKYFLKAFEQLSAFLLFFYPQRIFE